MNKPLIAFVVLASASFLSACGSDSSSSSSGTVTDAAAPANGVSVQSNKFVPASLAVKVGDTVTWTWAGGSHDVVSGANCAGDGAYKSALESSVGKTFTHTYDKAGTFEYFCTPHCSLGMKGSIVVQ